MVVYTFLKVARSLQVPVMADTLLLPGLGQTTISAPFLTYPVTYKSTQTGTPHFKHSTHKLASQSSSTHHWYKSTAKHHSPKLNTVTL